MKGVRPHGWPSGTSWDQIPGGYNLDMGVIIATRGGKVPATDPDVHGKANMVYHETLHAYDHALGNFSQRSLEFTLARNADIKDLEAYYTRPPPVGQQEPLRRPVPCISPINGPPARCRICMSSGRTILLRRRNWRRRHEFDRSATMEDDGTIIMQLRAEGPGVLGDARLVYQPTHPDYPMIRRHLDGLTPGHSMLVPPFDDKEE
jgi:hypothetical protein